MFKNSKKSLLLVAISIFMSLTTAQKSQAIIALYGGNEFFGSNSGPAETTVSILGCVLILPLCILDKSTDNFLGIDKQIIIDNGYSESEASQIIAEFKKLVEHLAASKQKISVAATDTQESLTAQIKSVYPEASDLFIDFYINELIAQ
ncbi:MAG: hypothetical protein ACOYOK_05245 [Pseudobdellovibrionaceae bacterium]